MPQPIVLLAPQRSGTTVLQKTLACGSKVEAFGEVFHENKGEYHLNFFNFLRINEQAADLWLYPTLTNRIDLFRLFIDYLSNATTKRFFIVDIKENSLHHFNPIWMDVFDQPFVIRLCRDLKIPIVRLKRKNLFLQVLSQDVSDATAKWHILPDSPLPEIKLVVNCEEYMKRIKRFIRERDFIDTCLDSENNKIEFWYEDLFTNNRISSSAISALEMLIGEDLDADHDLFYKKSIDIPSNFIANQHEVKEYFRSTCYHELVCQAFGSI